MLICQIHKRSNYFAKNCKFGALARICSKAQMLPYRILILPTRLPGRIDNVALKRWALFTVE